ncbi:hypothetical protein LshimejAT787_0700320 [Lyophyllum shimeji]|uniref:Uncharacterized protein n=1 Tax=Lyophyllum shimeji TaxID=47721 RepID=A0A9P3UNP0_LYOSH|nr:hypothetical protein LshimejAT787_0700320 [Lyophyllum shimeji]
MLGNEDTRGRTTSANEGNGPESFSTVARTFWKKLLPSQLQLMPFPRESVVRTSTQLTGGGTTIRPTSQSQGGAATYPSRLPGPVEHEPAVICFLEH